MAGLAVLAAWAVAPAHPSLGDRLDQLTHAIEHAPREARPHWERGEEFRRSGDLEAARADFERAIELEPDFVDARHSLALVSLSEARLDDAMAEVSAFLGARPEDPAGTLTRARIHAAADRYDAAVEDMDFALARLEPSPDLYVERANLARGRDGDALGEAISRLDEGLERLGNLPTLQLAAIEIEIELERFDAALNRVEALLPLYARRESLLARRGDILTLAGRRLEAQAAYTDALDALLSLEPHVRGRPATLELEARLREELRISSLADSGRGAR